MEGPEAPSTVNPTGPELPDSMVLWSDLCLTEPHRPCPW